MAYASGVHRRLVLAAPLTKSPFPRFIVRPSPRVPWSSLPCRSKQQVSQQDRHRHDHYVLHLSSFAIVTPSLPLIERLDHEECSASRLLTFPAHPKVRGGFPARVQWRQSCPARATTVG